LQGDHLSDRERGWLHKDGKARSAGGACWRYLHDTAAIALRGVGAGHGVSLGGWHAGRGRLVDLVPVAVGRLHGGGACARTRRNVGVILHGLEGKHFATYRVINQCANYVGCGAAPYFAGGYLVGADSHRVGFLGALIFLGVEGVCETAPRDDVSFSVCNQGAGGQIRCGRVEVTVIAEGKLVRHTRAKSHLLAEHVELHRVAVRRAELKGVGAGNRGIRDLRMQASGRRKAEQKDRGCQLARSGHPST
jgi:hypothetical protein